MTVAPPRTYVVNAKSSDTFGRVLCQTRQHHFVIDGPVQNGCPGEAVTPAESFLAGVGACGVELIEVIARELGVPLKRAQVEISGTIDRSQQPRQDVTLFTTVELAIQTSGVSQEQAEDLVNRFRSRCPLFGTVFAATKDVRVSVTAKP